MLGTSIGLSKENAKASNVKLTGRKDAEIRGCILGLGLKKSENSMMRYGDFTEKNYFCCRIGLHPCKA